MDSPVATLSERLPKWVLAAVAGLALAAIPLAALVAQETRAPFTVVETGRGYPTLQLAVAAIGDGKGTIQVAEGNWRECAVQSEGFITYRAAVPGKSLLGGTACEGKGLLVLRGRGARVEGLVLADVAVSDGNGAGIRLEKGPLHVSQTWFRDSQQGILTHSDTSSEMVIDKSTFTRLGTCEYSGGCAHSIYAGDYGRVVVTRSRFEQGRGGHYVKSRAARTVIEDCSFDDSHGRGTNYMIDLPNGGSGAIRGNWFVQGADKENWTTFIAVGAENAQYSSDGLVIEGNDARLVPGISRKPAFVGDWTGDRLAIGRNTLGPGLKPFDAR
ncbi:MAG: right-handed parallel beta-helix repeat-containing protein [Erythrobacter sp.]